MRCASEDRRRLKAEIVARVGAGAAQEALGLPVWTARNWGQADPLFAGELAQAERVGRFRRLRAKAAAFLARVRAGEKVADLFGKPGMPSRLTYGYWKATQAPFAEAM